MRWRGEIFGHRGAAGTVPENTLESFEAAIAAGADGIELDVRVTSDGQAVVFHDADTCRFVPPGSALPVSQLALREMQALDVGAALGQPGCRVPSLHEALERIGRRARLNVEIKGAGPASLAAVDLAIAALLELDLADDTVLSTFHEAILGRMAEAAPRMARAFIVDRRFTGDAIEVALRHGAEGLHPSRHLVDAAVVGRCRAAGLAIRCWTVNEADEILRVAGLGVDAIVSDFPGRVAELTR